MGCLGGHSGHFLAALTFSSGNVKSTRRVAAERAMQAAVTRMSEVAASLKTRWIEISFSCVPRPTAPSTI